MPLITIDACRRPAKRVQPLTTASIAPERGRRGKLARLSGRWERRQWGSDMTQCNSAYSVSPWGNERYILTVMPEHYHPDDAKWIQEKLQKFSVSAQRKVVALYADVYQSAWGKEPVSFRQDNRARHEANTRLREFVTKHARSAAGLTEKPPLAKAQAQHGMAGSSEDMQQDRQ